MPDARTAVAATLVVAALGTAGVRAQAPPPPAQAAAAEIVYGRALKGAFQTFMHPADRFSLEYPRRDWLVVEGGSTARVSLVHKKNEAGVIVERSLLNQALAPNEITELFTTLEVDAVRAAEPSASSLDSRLIDADGRRVIVITFSRPGVAGVERVRQYSIPQGRELYRLICFAALAVFPKYQTVFAHAAASFVVGRARPETTTGPVDGRSAGPPRR